MFPAGTIGETGVQQDLHRGAFSERSRARDAFLEQRFTEDLFSFQYIFTEFFIEHLCDSSRLFKGDVQQLLLLTMINQVHLRWLRELRRTGTQKQCGQPSDPSISASRLADCCGIPRETVRRKLVQLQNLGLVDRGPNGKWRLVLSSDGVTPEAQLYCGDVSNTATKRIAHMIARLEDLADRIQA